MIPCQHYFGVNAAFFEFGTNSVATLLRCHHCLGPDTTWVPDYSDANTTTAPILLLSCLYIDGGPFLRMGIRGTVDGVFIDVRMDVCMNMCKDACGRVHGH